jgi:hypothetical protein
MASCRVVVALLTVCESVVSHKDVHTGVDQTKHFKQIALPFVPTSPVIKISYCTTPRLRDRMQDQVIVAM